MTDSKNNETGTMIHSARVVENLYISKKFHRLRLSFEHDSAKAFAAAVPGQFAEFELSSVSLPAEEEIPAELADKAKKNILLRRPLSFSDIRPAAEDTVEIDVLYCVLGSATLRMKSLKQGARISVIGPLGKGFRVDKEKKFALLVAGGIGAPPIQHMAGYLKANYPKIEAIAFAGAKTITDMPYFKINIEKVCDEPDYVLDEFTKAGAKSVVTTDDGSAGIKGFVTEALQKWLTVNAPAAADCQIYACGPEAMLRAVAGVAEKNGIDCQVSMERHMACGIGICQSCTVETVSADGEKVYKLCCKDGPVFDAAEIIW